MLKLIRKSLNTKQISSPYLNINNKLITWLSKNRIVVEAFLASMALATYLLMISQSNKETNILTIAMATLAISLRVISMRY